MNEYMLGFDIGGTKCAVVLGERIGSDIRILDRKAISTNLSISPDAMLDQLDELAEVIIGERNISASSIGVSCGGPLDSVNGIVLGPPNLPGWDHVPVTDRLHAKYGVPAFLQNDADACALAEWRWGAGRGLVSGAQCRDQLAARR